LPLGAIALLRDIEIDCVVEGVDIGIELEARIDVGDRFHKAAEIHFGKPAAVHDQEIVLTLRRSPAIRQTD
jgi:predicted signal transduction protein with EAL and GGDEF domain